MSYRTPRFSWVHQVVDTSDTGWTGDTSAFDAADPRTRLGDYQGKLNAVMTPLVATTLEFEVSDAAPARFDLNRLIIPQSTALRDRLVSWGLYLIDRVATKGAVATHDNNAVIDYYAPDSWIDIYFAGKTFVDDSVTYDAEEAGCLRIDFEEREAGQAKMALSEVWWTATYQPTTGIASGYTDQVTPTATRRTMESGASYTRIDGPPRRAFTLDHVGIAEGDLRLYQRLIKYSEGGAKPFWYEHPDSGDAEEVISTLLDADETYSNSGCTIADVSSSPDYHSGNVLEMTATGAGIGNVDFEVSSGVTDWTDSTIEFDCMMGQDNSGALTLGVTVFDTRGRSSFWGMGSPMASADYTDQWIRLAIDTSKVPDGTFSAGRGAEMGEIEKVQFVYLFGGAGQTLRLANLRKRDNAKRPVLVTLKDAITFEQSSPVPSVQSLWDVRMSMIEETS